MLPEFLSKSYPANDITDGQYLYRSLGSFWGQVFQDKNALKGYTIGMAEEAIQAYYNLLEVINKYSVKDIQILHKERWLPIEIKKSEYNKTPLMFEADGAVFGIQPDTDTFYAGRIFHFGFPKQTDGANLFSFTPKVKLGKIGAISNRVIAPSLTLIPGVDIAIKNNTLYFNTDLFNNDKIPRVKLVDDLGVTLKYKDENGHLLDEELIVLWMYHPELDQNSLYDNFGVLLDLKLPSSQAYKELLKAVINLFVAGPTLSALNAAIAALCNTPVVVDPVETVEDIYNDSIYNYVITDKNVYKFPYTHTVKSTIKKGSVLYAGEILTGDLTIIDTVMRPHWWVTDLDTNKLAFSSHVFAANTQNQLIFENNVQLLTYINGTLKFPVLGRPQDVALFQEHINAPENKSVLLSKLGIAVGSSASIAINPLDYVFSNMFKNNTLLIKSNFHSEEQLTQFFSLFDTLRPYLPSHVYVLVYLNLQLDEDSLDNLNASIRIPGYTQTFCADGSARGTGARPGAASSDVDYYKDFINRMFCVSVGPYKDGQPLHADGSAAFDGITNLDTLPIDNSTSTGTAAGIKAGLLRTYIPTSYIPPGESTPRPPSTREVQSILLIDF